MVLEHVPGQDHSAARESPYSDLSQDPWNRQYTKQCAIELVKICESLGFDVVQANLQIDKTDCSLPEIRDPNKPEAIL